MSLNKTTRGKKQRLKLQQEQWSETNSTTRDLISVTDEGARPGTWKALTIHSGKFNNQCEWSPSKQPDQIVDKFLSQSFSILLEVIQMKAMKNNRKDRTRNVRNRKIDIYQKIDSPLRSWFRTWQHELQLLNFQMCKMGTECEKNIWPQSVRYCTLAPHHRSRSRHRWPQRNANQTKRKGC